MFCFSIMALAAQEDVTTPGEFAGNFGGALLMLRRGDWYQPFASWT